MKKKMTLKQAAKKISDILWTFLETLPLAERRRRLDKAHKRIMERKGRKL